jgi:hypothetical protein
MLTKFASAAVLSAEMGDQRATFRTAHRHSFIYEKRPGFLYVRSRAISSRTNDNFDTFPAEEIKTAYRTFVGKPVFVNHRNDNHRRARGVIIDAALHEDTNPDGTPDTWVEVLMEIDGQKFPKLAQAILAGEVDRTSMGTDVEYSVCSFCGNRASTPLEYCQHIPKLKGKRIRRRTASGTQEDVLVHEICYGLRFFENSLLVEEPADPTAYFLGVESGPGVVSKAASKPHHDSHAQPQRALPGLAEPRRTLPGHDDFKFKIATLDSFIAELQKYCRVYGTFSVTDYLNKFPDAFPKGMGEYNAIWMLPDGKVVAVEMHADYGYDTGFGQGAIRGLIINYPRNPSFKISMDAVIKPTEAQAQTMLTICRDLEIRKTSVELVIDRTQGFYWGRDEQTTEFSSPGQLANWMRSYVPRKARQPVPSNRLQEAQIPTGRPSMQDIENMSDEEYQRYYDSMMADMRKNMGEKFFPHGQLPPPGPHNPEWHAEIEKFLRDYDLWHDTHQHAYASKTAALNASFAALVEASDGDADADDAPSGGSACPGTDTPVPPGAPHEGRATCPACGFAVYVSRGRFLRHTGKRPLGRRPKRRNSDWLSGFWASKTAGGAASLNNEFRFLAYDPGEKRDKSGEWTTGPGGHAAPKSPRPGAEDAGKDETEEAAAEDKPKREDREEGHPQNPIETDDVEVAAKALAEGKHVNLKQPRVVSTLLDKLGDMIKDARAKGQDVEIDLCNVTVKGTNLFCVQSKGVPRIQMPQLKTKKPFKDSKILKENIPKGPNGEYNLQPLFRKMLVERGVAVEPTTEKATFLKATQNQLRSSKIAGMADWIEGEIAKTGKPPVVLNEQGEPDRIFVSKDNYIVDGHHRWAALAATDWADGKEGDLDVDIDRIDMDIIPLLAEANKFCEEWGMPFLDWLDKPDPKAVEEHGGVEGRRRLAALRRTAAVETMDVPGFGTINYRTEDRERVEALLPYVQTGPDYRRGVVSNLRDYSLFVGRGEWDSAEAYLLYAEGKTVKEAWDIIEGRLPFEAAVGDGVDPEYRKHYNRGWKSRNLEGGDARNEPESWYDGYFDNAAGREKFHTYHCRRNGGCFEHKWGAKEREATRTPPPGTPAMTSRANTRPGEKRLAMPNPGDSSLQTISYGEAKAPAQVDTLRDADCPVCGEEAAYDGEKCLVCGFVKPPDSFMDPDLEQARDVDLRQDEDEGAVEPGNEQLVCDQCGAKFNSDPTAETEADAAPVDGGGDINAEFEQMFGGGETSDSSNDEDEDATDEDGKPKKKSKPPWMDKQSKTAAPASFPQSPSLPHPPSKDGTPTSPKLKGDEEQPDEIPETTPQAGDTCPECGKGTLRPVGNDKLDQPDQQPPQQQGQDSQTEAESEKKDQNQKQSQKEQIMRPVLAALAEQQKIIDRQAQQIAALRRGLEAIARLAGVDQHPKFAALMKVADENNPAQPIADPPAEAPAETTEEALGDLNDTDVEAIGATPVTDVSADATTDVTGTETVLDEPLDLNEQDPTRPVTGTEGPLPLADVKTETDVRVGNPNNPDTAFPLEGDFAQRATTGAREARTFAALRLARLRIQAGIDDGDDLAMATDIASSDISDEVMQAEINTLSKVIRQGQGPARQAKRNLVPRSASRERTAPSFVEPPQPQMQVTASVDADELLFE